MRMHTKNKGQSSVEYIILVTAIIAVAIAFLADDGIFRNTLNGVLGDGAATMNTMSQRLKGSIGTTPGNTTPGNTAPGNTAQ